MVRIKDVAGGSIAASLKLRSGDELVEINGHRIRDEIDLRFYEVDQHIELKCAHNGKVALYEIEKEIDEPLGIVLDDMKVLRCGNNCIFCFVDQNPRGLRDALYIRDGDYRLSFMYGNYTTLTNAGNAILQRIVEQRLSPLYISVHSTVPDIRRRLLGLRKDDHLLEKMRFLANHGIDMHAQIVLCPGINDGASLQQTIQDMWELRDHVISLAIVPVGLTDHRASPVPLQRVDKLYAKDLLQTVRGWQERFRAIAGRNFVYPSDEFFLLAEEKIPDSGYYDGFPQIENGVGMVRSFLDQFARASSQFPRRIPEQKTITLATGVLASPFIRDVVAKRLSKITGLDVRVAVASNRLFGKSVTVAGLLSGKCFYEALHDQPRSDLVLLPPDVLNEDELFLDDWTLGELSMKLDQNVLVFDGNWGHVFRILHKKENLH